MRKKLLIIGAIVLTGVVLFVWHPWRKTALAPMRSDLKTYQSEKFNFTFNYPERYFLEEKQFDDGHAVIILSEDTQENKDVREGRTEGRDGPVVITFIVYPNSEQVSVLDWIKTHQESNFNLMIGNYSEVTVANKNAISYVADGLYISDNIALLHNGYIIVASVMYLTSDDQIRKDFQGILATLSMVTSVPFTENRAYCFQRVQKATSDAPYSVEEHIKLTRVRGDIIGTKVGTQSGPDMTNGYQGTLTGTTDGNNLNLIYSYIIEGSAQKETEIYVISDQNLIKQRYVLTEKKQNGETILVPDTTTSPTLITYSAAACDE